MCKNDMLEKMYEACRIFANKKRLLGPDRDDFLQNAYTYILEKNLHESYDPSRGVSPAGYLWRHLQGVLRKTLDCGSTKIGKNKVLSLDYTLEGSDDTFGSMIPDCSRKRADEKIEKENNKELLVFIDKEISKLPPAQRKALTMICHGSNTTERIAAKLECSSATVRGYKKRFVDMMKEKYGHLAL